MSEEIRTYKIQGGWGSAINIDGNCRQNKQGRPFYKGHGFQSRRPNEGDLLLIDMQSGRTMVTKFFDIDYCRDPNDMFFWKAWLLHYEDTPNEQVWKKPSLLDKIKGVFKWE